MIWMPIKTIPDNRKQVLVGFQGQFKWYSFVVEAQGQTTFPGYAEPTHWTEITPPDLRKKNPT